MSRKKIDFKPKLHLASVEKKLDDWVMSKTSDETSPLLTLNTAPPLNEEARFTVVIPTYLHRRIKKYCAMHGISIKTKLIEIFENEFPET